MEIDLADAIADIIVPDDAVPLGPEHRCSYLPGRSARDRAFIADAMPPLLYHRLLEQGYRRSGRIYYKPDCAGCKACEPMRVRTASFRPSRSQRRVWRKNADLRVETNEPIASEDRHALFVRYLEDQHDGTMSGDYDAFRAFLYDTQVDTVEVSYWLDDALVGVGILDQCPLSLSTVYFYFDPDHGHRSLGVYSTLWEIAHARQREIPYYYLGYYIRDAATMNYKARFRPHERRMPDGTWQGFDDGTVRP